MPATESSSPPARYGFALRHGYGCAVLALAFTFVFVASDLVTTYGQTGARYPYVIAIPFTGLLLTLGLGIWLAIVAGGDIESPVAQSFLPLYAVGAGIWLAVAAALAAVLGEWTTTTVSLLALIVVGGATHHSSRSFARPHSVDPGRRRWPEATVAANACAMVAVGALYTGALPIEFTQYVLVAYAVTTLSYPFALFVDGYRHAARRNLSWRFTALVGCLGVVGLVTLGIVNWLITPLYALIRFVTALERE